MSLNWEVKISRDKKLTFKLKKIDLSVYQIDIISWIMYDFSICFILKRILFYNNLIYLIKEYVNKTLRSSISKTNYQYLS